MPTKKIYTNTLAQIAGKVATAIISIGMIKIVTGYLDIAWYGLYSKIYNYLSIFAVIADLGLYTITVRELTKYAEDERMVAKISSNILTLRTWSGLLIVVLSLIIAPFLQGYDSMMALLGIFIAGLFTLLGLINSSLMSYLQATLRTEFSFIANTSGKLLTFGMVIMFVWVFFPSSSDISEMNKYLLIMLAGLAWNMLMTWLTWWYANKWHPIRFGWDITYIKHILTLSLPYWIALFLNVIFFKADTILLSVMESSEIADTAVALYSLPMKIVEVGMMYGTVFLNSLLPVLTTAIEKKEQEKEKKLMNHALLLLGSAGLMITLSLFFLAPWVIEIISTNAYIHTTVMGYTAVDAMRIVVWIFLVYFVSSLFTYSLIAHGEQKNMMYINAIIAFLNIIGNIIVIPMFSFIGSAWVTLGTQVLLLILTWWFVKKRKWA